MTPLQSRVQASFDRQKFLALLGARLEAVEPGQVSISCERREDLTQQQGFLHGGVVASIADVACGYAALTVIPEGREVLTAEFKINLLRPVIGRKILATGTVLKPGHSLVITEAEVLDEESGKPVAKILATMVPAFQKEEKQVDFCCECPEFSCEHTGMDENLCQRHVAIHQEIAKIGPEAYYDAIKDVPR